jgi:hypothetical protein
MIRIPKPEPLFPFTVFGRIISAVSQDQISSIAGKREAILSHKSMKPDITLLVSHSLLK